MITTITGTGGTAVATRSPIMATMSCILITRPPHRDSPPATDLHRWVYVPIIYNTIISHCYICKIYLSFFYLSLLIFNDWPTKFNRIVLSNIILCWPCGIQVGCRRRWLWMRTLCNQPALCVELHIKYAQPSRSTSDSSFHIYSHFMQLYQCWLNRVNKDYFYISSALTM